MLASRPDLSCRLGLMVPARFGPEIRSLSFGAVAAVAAIPAIATISAPVAFNPCFESHATHIQAGRIAVVTAGGTGISRARCQQLGAAGVHVALCDVSATAMAAPR